MDEVDEVQQRIEAALAGEAVTIRSHFSALVTRTTDLARRVAPTGEQVRLIGPSPTMLLQSLDPTLLNEYLRARTLAFDAFDLIGASLTDVLEAKATLVGLAEAFALPAEALPEIELVDYQDHRYASNMLDHELGHRFGPRASAWAAPLTPGSIAQTERAYDLAFDPAHYVPRDEGVLNRVEAAVDRVRAVMGLLAEEPGSYRQAALQQLQLDLAAQAYARYESPRPAHWRALDALVTALPMAAAGDVRCIAMVDDCLVGMWPERPTSLAAALKLDDAVAVTPDKVELLLRSVTRQLPTHLGELLSPTTADALAGELEDRFLAFATTGTRPEVEAPSVPLRSSASPHHPRLPARRTSEQARQPNQGL